VAQPPYWTGESTGISADICGVWVEGRRTWFAACDGAIYELNLSGRFAMLHQAPGPLRAITGTPDGALWAVGANGLVESSTTMAPAVWSTIPTETTEELRGVHGSSSGSIWVVGENGLILHVEQGALTTERVGESTLNAVWESPAGAVWVVGMAGTILERTAEGWIRHEAAPSSDLYGIAARSSDELWLVGSNSTVVKRALDSWSTISVDSTARLNAVWASAEDVWAVGEDGVVGVRGTEDLAVERLPLGPLRAIAGTYAPAARFPGEGGLYLWAAGDRGKVVRFAQPVATICD
jgi:hypothetical protein